MLIDIFLPAFVALFVIVDPIAIAPIFGALSTGAPKAQKRAMALRGTLVGTVLIVSFGFFGQDLLSVLGISLPALRMAGGVMLFLIALEMVFEKRTERRQHSAEAISEDTHAEDIAVFPIAMPLIAGPGALATIMLLMAKYEGDFVGQVLVMGALAIVMVTTLIFLLLAEPIMRVMGSTMTMILTRVLGIILSGLAVQYLVDGIKASFSLG